MSPTDLLPIADLSASETKAITAKDLLEGVVINMDAGSIPVGKIDFSAGIPDGNILVTQGDVVLGRTTGAGKSEEIPCTAAGRALLAGVDAAAQRTVLGWAPLRPAAVAGLMAAILAAPAAAPILVTRRSR